MSAIRFSMDSEVFARYATEVGAIGGTEQDLYDRLLEDEVEISEGKFSEDVTLKQVSSRLTRLKGECKDAVKAGHIKATPPLPITGKTQGRAAADKTGLWAVLNSAAEKVS